jgi:probable phosphoglycerate mutase
MSTELVLVRHGQTDWNSEGRYQGQAGPGLNDAGREQARSTARELASMHINALYTSDLRRALETAHIIADTLDVSLRTDPRLREINQGVWQGMLFADIQARYGEDLRRFRHNPVENSPPGGETVAQLAHRVTAALDDIAAHHPEGHVVVVTHKLPIALIRCMATGRPPEEVWNAIPENAQAVIFKWPLQTGIPDPDVWLRHSR